MNTKTIDYTAGNIKLRGYLAFDSKKEGKRPGIIIAHAWRGQDDFARQKAVELAELGYVALAADVYGNGQSVNTNEEATSLMMPLFLDRKLLRERIIAAYELLKSQPEVDAHQIGAIGFCFGGLTVIELFRSGAEVKGVVSFHGTLGNAMGDRKATTHPIAKGIKGSILILHGNDDPLVSLDDILNIQREFTQAGVDWEMDIYGNTMHAFTNPEAHEEALGLVYNKKTSERAWQRMLNFFTEIFH
jgi:dienelactone hydrolase